MAVIEEIQRDGVRAVEEDDDLFEDPGILVTLEAFQHVYLVFVETEIIAVRAIGAFGSRKIIAFASASGDDDHGHVAILGERGDDVTGDDLVPWRFVDLVLVDGAAGGLGVDPSI